MHKHGLLCSNEYFPWSSISVKFVTWDKIWIWQGCLPIIPEHLEIAFHAWSVIFPYVNRCYNRKDLGKEEMGLSHDYRAWALGRGATSKESWNSPSKKCLLFLSCFPKSSCLLSLSFTHVGLTAIKSIKETFSRRTLTGFLFLFLHLDFYSLAPWFLFFGKQTFQINGEGMNFSTNIGWNFANLEKEN